MKKIFVAFICLTSIAFFSCTKNHENKNVSTLIGNWLIIETLADPGDGSGKWAAVAKQDYHLQFTADSMIETTLSTGARGSKAYHVINDSSINFIDASGSTVNRYYNLSNSTLTIMGGCIEACGSRFKSVSK